MSYKLTYFDLRGRAEVIRLIFAAVGVKYTDERVKPENWPAVKSTMSWGQIPVLQIGDKTLAQSTTICRFLARKYNLVGASEWEAAKCDEYVDAVNDLFIEWMKFFFEKDEEIKALRRDEFMKIHFPKYFSKFNKIQEENGGQFIVGKDLTWADIYIADKLDRLQGSVDPDILNGYPNLEKLKNAVFSHPQIKAYVDCRPPK